MQQRWILCSIPAILLGLGLTAETCRADDARPMPSGPVAPPVIEHTAPVQGPAFSSGDVILPEAPAVADDPGRSHSFGERFRARIGKCLAANVPLFCWAHHNGLGCGN